MTNKVKYYFVMSMDKKAILRHQYWFSEHRIKYIEIDN